MTTSHKAFGDLGQAEEDDTLEEAFSGKIFRDLISWPKSNLLLSEYQWVRLSTQLGTFSMTQCLTTIFAWHFTLVSHLSPPLPPNKMINCSRRYFLRERPWKSMGSIFPSNLPNRHQDSISNSSWKPRNVRDPTEGNWFSKISISDWPGSGSSFPDSTDSGAECGVPYSRRFLTPTESKNLWYSFGTRSVFQKLSSC